MNKQKNIYSKILFIIYSIIMIWLLFGQRASHLSFDSYFEKVSKNINLIPFHTVKSYFKLVLSASNIYLVKHAIINLVGNIVMFIPLGLLLPCVFHSMQTFFKCLLVSAGIIFTVETVQLFTLLGSCDIDDLIFNLIGVILGYLTYILFKRIHKPTNT